MTNSIFIATSEPRAGKSLISLGIMDLLLRKTERVGLFRPVISSRSVEEKDKNINLLLTHFNLNIKYEDTFAFLKREADSLIAQGRYDVVLDSIIRKYKVLESKADFILCISSDFEGAGSAFEFDINADIAQNLGCPVLVVGNAAGRDVEATVNSVHIATDLFLERGCQVVGTIINRARPRELTDLMNALKAALPQEDFVLAVIPENKVLNSPSIREIARYLKAEVLYGENQIEKQAYHYIVIAMQVQNYLPRLLENALLITPGDRGDVILSALQAHQSQNYPQLAGIILSTGIKPAPSIQRLLDGLPNIIPILSHDGDTYETATQLSAMRSYITADNQAKIALSLKMFETFVDVEALEEKLASVKPRGITPRMFLYNIVQKAKAKKKHIVLPEGTDARILKATEILLDQGVVDITLLGNPTEVRETIERLGRRIDLKQAVIIEPETSPKFFDYVQTLYELRKDKGMTLESARELMTDVSYFGTMMVYKGHADGMVSGAVHTTQHTIRPALQFVKTKPGFSVVSSVFFMALEDRVLVYGDCAVNPNPTAEQLSEIAIASADTAKAFGVEPRVALLSYSSGESGQGEDVEKVRKATKLAQEKRPDLEIEGPIQYDAAVDVTVAQQKMPNSRVAGRATVLIFPDLNTGNNTYKAVQRETGAIAIGPILQGLNKPVNDLSRGCLVQDVINTIVITAIQAQEGS